jgi:hypothetical protein
VDIPPDTSCFLEKQLAEQNKKIEQQGNILDKILSFLRNVLGWK